LKKTATSWCCYNKVASKELEVGSFNWGKSYR
jgi:hypothetical protein